MLRLFVVVIAFICCESVPGGYGGFGSYGGYGGYGGFGSFTPTLGGGLASLSSHINSPIGSSYGLTGLGGGALLGDGYGGGGLAAGPIAAGPLVAPIDGGHQLIDVAGSEEPVQVIFRSMGARVHVQQIHTPSGPPQFEQHRTEDEPHRVLHEIVRPVIQEVREIIQPYRRVTQEIRPVLEEVHTVVAKSDHGHGGAGLGGVGLAGHGGYSKAGAASAAGGASRKA